MTEAQIKLARRAQFLGGYWKADYKAVISAVAAKASMLEVAQAKRAAVVEAVFALHPAKRRTLLEGIESARSYRFRKPVPTGDVDVMERLTAVLMPVNVAAVQRDYDQTVEHLAKTEAKLIAELGKGRAERQAEARNERANRGPQGLIDLLKIN
jgi:hypothetical protein